MNGLLRADKKLIENAKTELAKLPFGRQALKLKAVIAVNDHPAKTVAAVFGCSVGTLRNWVIRYTREGVSGLNDKKRKTKDTKLNREHTEEILGLLDSCSKRWTLLMLKEEIRKRFGVDMSLNGIWKMLKRNRYSHVSPRPIHHKQGSGDVGDFKKNLRK